MPVKVEANRLPGRSAPRQRQDASVTCTTRSRLRRAGSVTGAWTDGCSMTSTRRHGPTRHPGQATRRAPAADPGRLDPHQRGHVPDHDPCTLGDQGGHGHDELHRQAMRRAILAGLLVAWRSPAGPAGSRPLLEVAEVGLDGGLRRGVRQPTPGCARSGRVPPGTLDRHGRAGAAHSRRPGTSTPSPAPTRPSVRGHLPRRSCTSNVSRGTADWPGWSSPGSRSW